MREERSEKNLPGQGFLFEELNDDWRLEWLDMPEFSHEDMTPWRSIIIHFECAEDMKRLAEMIEQNLYPTTKSTWFPAAEIGRYRDRRYKDES